MLPRRSSPSVPCGQLVTRGSGCLSNPIYTYTNSSFSVRSHQSCMRQSDESWVFFPSQSEWCNTTRWIHMYDLRSLFLGDSVILLVCRWQTWPMSDVCTTGWTVLIKRNPITPLSYVVVRSLLRHNPTILAPPPFADIGRQTQQPSFFFDQTFHCKHNLKMKRAFLLQAQRAARDVLLFVLVIASECRGHFGVTLSHWSLKQVSFQQLREQTRKQVWVRNHICPLMNMWPLYIFNPGRTAEIHQNSGRHVHWSSYVPCGRGHACEPVCVSLCMCVCCLPVLHTPPLRESSAFK